MDVSESGQIQPLHLAERRFLEVLIPSFTLRRRGAGVELSVEFDINSPAIWNRLGKYDAQRGIYDFERKRAHYQAELDAFLLEGKGEEYRFDDPLFRFRYASGGTLPIVWMGGKRYYCLFYREIFPIGWNIANGGCDDRLELLNPLHTADREVSEELIVVDLKNSERYVFEGTAGKPFDRPEHAAARILWKTRFPEWEFERFKESPVSLRALPGPDRLSVRMLPWPATTVEGCFVNVNALDFGIEVDQIARLALDDDAILCDGEMVEAAPGDKLHPLEESLGYTLVNAPVGLFEVDTLNRDLANHAHEFVPDFFFYDALRYSAKDLLPVLEEQFIPSRDSRSMRTKQELAVYAGTTRKLDLCPVTRSIIRRAVKAGGYHAMPADVTKRGERAGGVAPQQEDPYEVFVCYGGPDAELARQVWLELTVMGRKVFFCEGNLANSYFQQEIEQALDSARFLVVVASRPDHLTGEFPSYEWRYFHQRMLNGHKTGGQIIPFVSGFDPRELPGGLFMFYAVECKGGDVRMAVQRLERALAGSKTGAGQA